MSTVEILLYRDLKKMVHGDDRDGHIFASNVHRYKYTPQMSHLARVIRDVLHASGATVEVERKSAIPPYAHDLPLIFETEENSRVYHKLVNAATHVLAEHFLKKLPASLQKQPESQTHLRLAFNRLMGTQDRALAWKIRKGERTNKKVKLKPTRASYNRFLGRLKDWAQKNYGPDGKNIDQIHQIMTDMKKEIDEFKHEEPAAHIVLNRALLQVHNVVTLFES